MECCTINACAFACSFLEILLGSVFIRPDTGAFSSPVRISQRRISPSVTTPSSFCCSLVTNKIPLALRSMRCIASTTVLSGDIKNNANCSVFIWEPPCFFFRFLQENVLSFSIFHDRPVIYIDQCEKMLRECLHNCLRDPKIQCGVNVDGFLSGHFKSITIICIKVIICIDYFFCIY